MTQPPILITGGSGTVGTAIARETLQAGNERVCIFSRGEAAQAAMRDSFDTERLRFFIGDVRDRSRLRRAMEGCATVYHCAALKRIEVGRYNPIEMVRTNIDGAVNVIEAALDAGVGKVVAVSTDKAFEPVSPYGYSKALADALFGAANNMMPAHGPRFAVVHLGNVAGSTGSVIPTWRAMVSGGRKSVPITDSDCTRFWMTPTQAAQAVICGESPEFLPAYALGDLAEAMQVRTHYVGLRDFEKKHELLRPGISSEHARRMSVGELRGALCRL